MNNSEYWKQRFTQLEAAQNEIGVEAYADIEKQYRQAMKDIESKIALWYQRLAKNNGISMAEARKLLNDAELKEFKWDVSDYIKYGKENAVTGQWVKELENASARYHISKFEALKIQTRQSLEELFAKQHKTVSSTMSDVFKSGYYHTAYELQKGFHIGWDISAINQSQVEKVLSKPWAVDGKNFSERIWGNKEKLINEVYNELSRNIITGADPQKAIDAIAKKMNTSKANAGRLVMTEEAYFSSAAQKNCYNDLDVEQYEIVATLDSHTSEICRSLDGKVFLMKDYQAGVTAPPFHVRCRSTTIPHFDDDFGVIGERAARNADGKTYYVPADMTYEQWYEKFVDNSDDLGIIKVGSEKMALENQRYGRNKSTLVNKTYIEGGEYKRKFDNATDNPKINKVLYDSAKAALKHRSGTVYEDMYWFDSKTGETILSVTDSQEERAVIYTDRMKKVIRDNDNIITLHTHPSSMPPSISDLNSCCKHNYGIGFIACHDGKVFAYTSKQLINERIYEMYIQSFIKDGFDEYNAQLKALQKLAYSFDISVWEVD